MNIWKPTTLKDVSEVTYDFLAGLENDVIDENEKYEDSIFAESINEMIEDCYRVAISELPEGVRYQGKDGIVACVFLGIVKFQKDSELDEFKKRDLVSEYAKGGSNNE